MRSKANFRGHPIHPALVHFPLAFLMGAFGFDLAGTWVSKPGWWTIGAYLAAVGVLTAVIAAIPGLLDYWYTVPPQSSAKQRATRHLVVNLAAVGLFALACLLRGGFSGAPTVAVLVMEGAGTALLGIGGYLGGVLVSRNQIGVDHRFAAAGRWQEQRFRSGQRDAIVVAQAGDLLVDQMKLLHIGGQRIVLARTEEGYTAFEDRCTHRGGSLADGTLISGTVQCPWHGSQFDVHTGAVCGGPAKQPIRAYRVEQRGADILLDLSAAPSQRAAARETAPR